jgi:phosphoglycerol transferase MdoB-like AlkP superfamily enzyme
MEKFPMTDRLWIFAYVLEYIYLIAAVFYIWRIREKPFRMIMKSFMLVPLILAFLINLQFLKFADVEIYRTVHKTDFGTQAELDEKMSLIYNNRGK